MLVLWTGLDAADGTWEPLDNLTNCADAIAAFEQATGRSDSLPPPPGTAPGPAGFSKLRSNLEFPILVASWIDTNVHATYW